MYGKVSAAGNLKHIDRPSMTPSFTSTHFTCHSEFTFQVLVGMILACLADFKLVSINVYFHEVPTSNMTLRKLTIVSTV
jgi:hypothetical protein